MHIHFSPPTSWWFENVNYFQVVNFSNIELEFEHDGELFPLINDSASKARLMKLCKLYGPLRMTINWNANEWRTHSSKVSADKKD